MVKAFPMKSWAIQEPPVDYNVEVDNILNGIENAVRNQSDTDFSDYFSENFDAKDWYRKFMRKLTSEQAETYSLSRFGDVKDGKLFQFTESVRLNESSTRRTPFDAVLLEQMDSSENSKKKLVIDSLTVHEAKPADDEEE